MQPQAWARVCGVRAKTLVRAHRRMHSLEGASYFTAAFLLWTRNARCGPIRELILDFIGDRVALTPFASVFYWRMAHGIMQYFPLFFILCHNMNAMQCNSGIQKWHWHRRRGKWVIGQKGAPQPPNSESSLFSSPTCKLQCWALQGEGNIDHKRKADHAGTSEMQYSEWQVGLIRRSSNQRLAVPIHLRPRDMQIF